MRPKSLWLVSSIGLLAAAARAGKVEPPLVYGPPGAGFSFDMTTGWTRDYAGPTDHRFLAPGSDTRSYPSSIFIEWRKNNPYMDAARYVQKRSAPGGDFKRKSSGAAWIKAAGRDASRFQTLETRPYKIETIKGARESVPLPAPVTVMFDIVVIPVKDGYCVLGYDAAFEDFKAGLPAFEKALGTLKIDPAR